MPRVHLEKILSVISNYHSKKSDFPNSVDNFLSSIHPQSLHFTASLIFTTVPKHFLHFVNNTPSSGESIVACIVPFM